LCDDTEDFDNKLLKRLYGGERNTLVIDIGELSFDACVLTLGKGAEFKVLAAATEMGLAGQAFDALLLQIVCDGFKADTGRDPRKDPKRMRDLRRRAMDVRDQLTRERRASVEFTYAGDDYEFFIKRDHFESQADQLLGELERSLRRMLKRWRLTWDDVDRIILVGPYARLPMIGKAVSDQTDGEVKAEVAPEHAKAKGAALYFALRPTPA
jgi:molecular chaperone DnaK (HSP70)